MLDFFTRAKLAPLTNHEFRRGKWSINWQKDCSMTGCIVAWSSGSLSSGMQLAARCPNFVPLMDYWGDAAFEASGSGFSSTFVFR